MDLTDQSDTEDTDQRVVVICQETHHCANKWEKEEDSLLVNMHENGF